MFSFRKLLAICNFKAYIALTEIEKSVLFYQGNVFGNPHLNFDGLNVREHTFNFMVFFGVKIFISRQSVSTLFFSTKTSFFRHKVVLSEYFFLPMSETNFFHQICITEILFPKKHIAIWCIKVQSAKCKVQNIH